MRISSDKIDADARKQFKGLSWILLTDQEYELDDISKAKESILTTWEIEIMPLVSLFRPEKFACEEFSIGMLWELRKSRMQVQDESINYPFGIIFGTRFSGKNHYDGHWKNMIYDNDAGRFVYFEPQLGVFQDVEKNDRIHFMFA